MEFVFFLFVLFALAAMDERSVHAELFPPGPCANCTVPIHFVWKDRQWVHDDGNVKRPMPNTGILHGAYPVRDFDTLSEEAA